MPKHNKKKQTVCSENIRPVVQTLQLAFELMDKEKCDFAFHYRILLLIKVVSDLMERSDVLKNPHIFLKCKYLHEKCLPFVLHCGHWTPEMKNEVLKILSFIKEKIQSTYVELVEIDQEKSPRARNLLEALNLYPNIQAAMKKLKTGKATYPQDQFLHYLEVANTLSDPNKLHEFSDFKVRCLKTTLDNMINTGYVSETSTKLPSLLAGLRGVVDLDQNDYNDKERILHFNNLIQEIFEEMKQ